MLMQQKRSLNQLQNQQNNASGEVNGALQKIKTPDMNTILHPKRITNLLTVLLLLLFVHTTKAQTPTVVTFPSSATWTCPAGVTSAKVECWGAGGAGGGFSSAISCAGGGGGGAYTVNNLVTVVPGTTYTVTVGVGPAGTNLSGTAGGNSIFGASLVVANGGAGGTTVIGGVGIGGAGGTGGTYNGGDGANGTLGVAPHPSSGGGGGGAGSTGSGGNAAFLNAGTAGGTDGGIGGAGRGSVAGSGDGNPGANYGGGGSGGRATAASNRKGGKGGNGFMRITYTIPSPFILRPFVQRYNNPTVKGNIVYVANSIVSTSGVGAGSPGTGEVPPTGSTMNNAGSGINIDVDADVTTINSSTSDLTATAVPACSKVLFAGLYWGAGEGSSSGSTAWITGQNNCKLKLPGSATYTTVTSTQTDFWNSTLISGYAHTGYQCFADITSLINTTNPNGTYTIADVVSPLGKANAYGGWTIVIAYTNSSLTPRNLSVYDGMAVVKIGESLDIPLSGFITPPTGPVSCELGSVVFDGDRAQTDEFSFKQGGAAAFYDLTPTANNPTSTANDFFNSIIGYKGSVVTTRVPAFQNTLGYSSNIINVPNTGNAQLSNNQTNALVRFSSSDENYLVQLVTTSITQFAPIFEMDKTATDRSGGTLTPGDSIRYQVNYNNTGNDTSINSLIIDKVPLGTSYIPNSLKIKGISKTDAAGDDEAEYDFVNNRVVFRLGVGANGIVGGTIPPRGLDSTGTVSFDVIIASSCSVLSCVGPIKNSARIAYGGKMSGSAYIDSSSVSTAGCLIKGPAISNAVGACFTPGDTLLTNNCPVTSIILPWKKYAGYTFYNAKPFIPANIVNPYLPITATRVYWAYFSNGAGCSDTIKVIVKITVCADIDDDNDGIPDYVEFNNALALQDHNTNGIPNWKDPLYPAYVDNNLDGVNDNFDYGADADNDGVPNYYDTDIAGYVDTNGDFINDNADKDKDGIPNQYDLDSDNDGIPDVAESYGVDANGDGVIDNYTDTDADGLSQNVDANNTGVSGSGNGLGGEDFDTDGIANYLDADSDNDGIPDVIEVSGTDANNDGVIDSFVDVESDGFSDNVDGDVGNDGVAENSVNALLLTGTDITPIDGRADNYPNKNFDNDTRPNVYDIDSDGDGITDVRESGFTDIAIPIGVVDGVIGTNGWSTNISVLVALNLRNTDAVGKPDYLDIDTDEDGIPDNIEGQATATYKLPTSADTDNDGLENNYDIVVGFGGTGNGYYDNDGDGIPDYRDLDTDGDGLADITEGNDFNLNGTADDLVTLTGLDTDGDGLDNRFDSLTSITNIKGTSYRMGTNGIIFGDPAPGARCPVYKKLVTQTDRDWRFFDVCTIASTNYAITPQTGSINWNALAWSLGHVPTCCESAHITYTGTNAGVDAVTVNITNDICIRNLTLVNAASSATNKIFRTIVAPGYNMVMNGNVRMFANGALTTDSCIFITNGAGTITVNGNTVIGYPTDNAYCVFGAAPSITSNENYVLRGDSLTFNNNSFTNDKFITVIMDPVVDTAYLVNNTNVALYPYLVCFENLKIGNGVKPSTVIVSGVNKNSHLNDRGGALEVTANSTLVLPANHTLNARGTYNSSLQLRTNSTLCLEGGSGGITGSNFPAYFTSYSLEPTSTVLFYGAAQSIPGTVNNVNTYGNIILTGSGEKTASASNVNLAGNLYRKNGGHTFNSNGGRVSFTSSINAQKYYTDPGATPIDFYDFTNNNTHSSGLSIDSTIGILNELELKPLTKITLNTGDIIMRSTAIRTSYVTNLGTTIPSIVYNTNYRFVVERYLFAKKSWRFLATPVEIGSSPSVTTAWRESNSALSSFGYGTQVTGPQGTPTFDQYTQRGSLKSYNAVTDKWDEVTNPSITLANTKGYMVFVRGDRGVAVGGTTGATNLRIKGNIRTGNQVFSVLANKFESFGNPYPARIDFKTVTKNNIADAFTVWNPSSLGIYNVGAYETYVFDGTNYVKAGGIIRNYIESGEAVFVQSNSALAGAVTVHEADKGSGSALVSRAGVTRPTLEVNLFAKDVDGTMYLADGVMLNFDNAYSTNVDNNDVRKIMNTADNLAVKNGNFNLVVERRPNLTANDTIKLSLTGVRVAPYRFEIDPSVLGNTGLEAFLKDKFLQTETPVSFTDVTTVPFDITATAASYAADRFMIIFKQGATTNFTTISAIRNADKTVTVNWGTEGERNVNNYTLEQSNDGINFTAIATQAATANNGTNPTYSQLDAAASNANNWYRVKATNSNTTVKYTAIAMVGAINEMAINAETKMSIYPNPVVGGNVNLHLHNQAKGNYSVQITNAAGQTIRTENIQVENNNTLHTIKMANPATGSYQATVIDEAGKKTTMSFLVK